MYVFRDTLYGSNLYSPSLTCLLTFVRVSIGPILLGIPPPTTDSNDEPLPSAAVAEGDWKKLPHHGDEEQVQLDVNRSFVYYPHSTYQRSYRYLSSRKLTKYITDLSDAALEERRSQLSNLITEVLRRCPFLCYFQGFHDICQVLLLVLQPAWAAPCVARLSVLRIRDFMLPNLGPTTAQLRLLPDVLGKADPELRRHVASIEPFYALAGTLTMYAHNIEAYHDIARLFDILLAREPVFSIYMFAQIVIDRRDEIFDIDEPDLLQVVLARVPPKMDLDALIERSAALFKRFPPETLRSWRRISKASALKTARDGQDAAKQTLEQGEEYFETQAKELRWIDLRDKMAMVVWRYRRPARAVGMAVAVSLVAFYIRRNPTMMHYIMSFFSK